MTGRSVLRLPRSCRQANGQPKRTYGTEADAVEELESRPQQYRRFRAYECPHCSGWHIGRRSG